MAIQAKRGATLPRGQAGLVLALVGLASLAWLLTDRRMAGMDAGPWTDLGTFSFYISSWVLMMAAMMFPSIVPMVLVYRLVQRSRRDLRPAAARGSTALFIGGYLISWAAFGALAYALQVVLRSASAGAFSWHRGGPYLAAGVLLAAAVYQLTPAKDACLRRCRGPLQFVTHAWRDGPTGAVVMGIEHGAWCVGCCWGLMAALFALGVMSLAWMVLIAALVALEKLFPWRTVANLAIAVVLAVLAISVSLSPASVPGLTVPGSAAAVSAMSMMDHMHTQMSGKPAAIYAKPMPMHATQMPMHAKSMQMAPMSNAGRPVMSDRMGAR